MIFRTIEKPSLAEYEEKKSRFIATIVPIAEFDTSLESLRQSHSKASHHVTAFRKLNEYDQVLESAKDDGEPAGTSGMPVLKTLIGANLINVGMIVTRYFGGTKLGTGGLARAYAGAANLAIKEAKLVAWKKIEKLTYQVSFEKSSEVERQIKLANLTILDRQYVTDGVVFMLKGAKEDLLLFQAALSN